MPEFKISERESTPRNDKEVEQKKFTATQIGDMFSELNKAHRKFKTGGFKLQAYEQERKRIYSKFAITKEERIKFLGQKFAN